MSRVGKAQPAMNGLRAIGDPRKRGPLDDLKEYVAAERAKGRTWAQIAKASGRSRADLEARFGRVFP